MVAWRDEVPGALFLDDGRGLPCLNLAICDDHIFWSLSQLSCAPHTTWKGQVIAEVQGGSKAHDWEMTAAARGSGGRS